MIIENESDVTDAVVASIRQTEDPRLREILEALVRHLHAFVRDVALTEDEFRKATDIVNTIGQMSNAKHNEAVLLCGSLGVSQLVCLLNNADDQSGITSQNLLGPFYRAGSPETANGDSIIRCHTAGDPLQVELVFLNEDDEPVDNLEVDVWQCNSEGLYENQDPDQVDMNLRGKFRTDEEGRIWFKTIKQSGYPIPVDTIAGTMISIQGRHPFRPAHLHVLAHKRGYKTLITQIYDSDDPNLDSDVQFGVTQALIGRIRPSGNASGAEAECYRLAHTLMLRRGESSLPTAPIR